MDDELLLSIRTLALSLGLGLLIGMQRERAHPRIAGLRTFALITLLGTMSAMLASSLGGWIVAVALLGVIAAAGVSNYMVASDASIDEDPGMTTEMAMIVMFIVGAMLVLGSQPTAVVVGGIVALLLHSKSRLHGLVGKLGDDDFRAIMQFVLITLVILPVLPNQAYGPFEVLNPFQIWLMVVLIVGISLAAYIAYKFLGERAGSIAGGVLGGLISSTATTVSYARQSRIGVARVDSALFVMLLASAVVYIRVIVEVLVVAGRGGLVIVAPVLVMLVIASVLAGVCGSVAGRRAAHLPSRATRRSSPPR